MIDIIQAFEDSKIFGSLIRDQKSWANWKAALKAIFALPMTAEEVEVYQKFTGRGTAPESPFKEVFLIIGRRRGKSFISALIAVFLAVFKDWRKHLRPGEIGYVMCIASDRKQASGLPGDRGSAPETAGRGHQGGKRKAQALRSFDKP
jgi:phage terminase large subunit-like protein